MFGDRALRTLVLLGWLIVFYTIPQGIAAPYAARLGGGPVATGLVLASTAAATAIATPLFSRFVSPRRRLTLMGPLAAATGGTLAFIGLRPGLAVSLVIFSAASASGAYQLAVNTAFVVRVPDERRAQAFGIASMGVVVAQGAAFVAAGAAAEVVTPASVIAAGGGIGAVVAIALTFSWRRVTSAPRRPAGGPAPREPGGPAPAEVMVGGGAREYLREFTTEERYPRTSTGLLTRPGRPRAPGHHVLRAGSSSTLTAPVRRESFSASTASSQRSSGKRWVMTGVRSRPPATKSK